MKTLIVLGIIFTLILAYVMGGRAWLRSKPWMAGFFNWIEPWEVALYKKSETILWARLKIVTGLLLTVLTQIGTIDLTPLWPFIPDQYENWIRNGLNLTPLGISIVGWIDEWLRNRTTAPIEVVAMAERDKTPEVKAAEVKLEDAKAEVVAAVQEAKA